MADHPSRRHRSAWGPAHQPGAGGLGRRVEARVAAYDRSCVVCTAQPRYRKGHRWFPWAKRRHCWQTHMCLRPAVSRLDTSLGILVGGTRGYCSLDGDDKKNHGNSERQLRRAVHCTTTKRSPVIEQAGTTCLQKSAGLYTHELFSGQKREAGAGAAFVDWRPRSRL